MSLRWHKIGLSCPKCLGEPTILSFFTAADGEVMLEMICVLCGIKLAWKSDMVKLITDAFNSDMREDAIQHKPIRPPLAKTCEKIADDKWLHELGIGGE